MNLRCKPHVFLAVFVLFFSLIANTNEIYGQKLRVAYTAFAGTFTILWVGKDAGLYQKYGADLVMVGCQYDKGQTSFFTTAPIANVGELKGKAVGVSRFGAFSDFVARHVLKKYRLQPVKEVALIQLGGTREIIAGMQNNLVQGGSISLPLTLQARKLGLRELLSTEQIALPFDYGCFIVKHSYLKSNREELKRVLRATIAAYDLAIQDPALAKKAIGKYTRTTDMETLDAAYKEHVKEYALRIPYVSAAGLRSIVEFRGETAAEVKKLALEGMYDNSLLQEIQRKR